MTREYLLEVLGDARSPYIVEAQRLRSGEAPRKARSPRRLLLIAAVMALGLLLVGCALVYALRLGDLTLRRESREESVPTYYDDQGNTIPTDPSAAPWAWVSIQGANQSALRQWLDFKAQYDPEGKQRQRYFEMENAGVQAVPENYSEIYSCYSPEMAQKLKEIADQNGLELLREKYDCPYPYQAPALLEALKLPGILREPSAASAEYGHGFFFDDGSFTLTVRFSLPGDAWPYGKLSADFSLVRKDCLYPYSAAVSLSQVLTEWNYTAVDGSPCLLVLDGVNGHIFADRGDAFCHIYLAATAWNGGARASMTGAALEQIADCFDLSITPSQPDHNEVSSLLDRAQAEYDAAAEQEPYSGDYGAYVTEQLKAAWGPAFRDSLMYSLYDLNGDGVEELIDYRNLKILTCRDGQCEPYFSSEECPSLLGTLRVCENGVVRITDMGWGEYDSFYFFRPEREHMVFWQSLVQGKDGWTLYREPNRLEGTGIVCPTGGESITEQQAQAILDSYPLAEIGRQSMKRFGEPMKTYDFQDPYAGFLAEMLDKYENSEQFTYALEDLQGNGAKTLIVKMPMVREWNGVPREAAPTIFQQKNGLWVSIGEFTYACENGILCQQEGDSFQFFRLEEDELVLVDKIFNDEYGYWMRRDENQSAEEIEKNGGRANYTPLTQEQAQQMIAAYKKIELDWKPFSQYPS